MGFRVSGLATGVLPGTGCVTKPRVAARGDAKRRLRAATLGWRQKATLPRRGCVGWARAPILFRQRAVSMRYLGLRERGRSRCHIAGLEVRNPFGVGSVLAGYPG